MTARTYRSAAYVVALILIATVMLMLATAHASAATGGIAWETTTTSSTTSAESSTTSTAESTSSTTTTTSEVSSTTSSTSQTTTTQSTTSPPQTHPPVTPPPTTTAAGMTPTQSNGEFLAIVGIAGLFALVLYLLLSIRDAEKIHPYKRWADYQNAETPASGIPTPPDDDKYAFYHEATTEPGVQITGPITMVDPVTAIDRGIDT